VDSMVKQENGKGAAVCADDMDEDVAGALSQSQTETSPAWAELVSLNDSWQNFPLTVDIPTVFMGRGNACKLKYDDPRISTLHAKLERGPLESGVAVLHDLSSNGTFVNGEKIGKGNSKNVKDGDMISLIVVPVQNQDGTWSHTDETIKKIFVAYTFKYFSATSQIASQPPKILNPASQPSQTTLLTPAAASGSIEEMDARVEEEQEGLSKLVASLEKKNNKDHFERDFEQSTMLGEGGFAKVYIGKHRETAQEVAVKVIDVEKWKLNRGTLRTEQIEEEVSIHQKLRHPNVVRLIWCYSSRRYLHIVLEKVNGGDLFDYLVNGGKGLEEDLSRRWFHQLLKAVEYMHDNGVVHRDLKPENILLDRNDETATLKISDFGLAKITAGSAACQTRCGTINYMAPEVAAVGGDKIYGKEADVWGLGVILHVMVSLTMPFEGEESETEKQLIQMAKGGKGTLQLLHGECWRDRSPTLKSLLRHLLTPDIKKRATLQDAFGSAWVKGKEAESPMAKTPDGKRKDAEDAGSSSKKRGRKK